MCVFDVTPLTLRRHTGCYSSSLDFKSSACENTPYDLRQSIAGNSKPSAWLCWRGPYCRRPRSWYHCHQTLPRPRSIIRPNLRRKCHHAIFGHRSRSSLSTPFGYEVGIFRDADVEIRGHWWPGRCSSETEGGGGMASASPRDVF